MTSLPPPPDDYLMRWRRAVPQFEELLELEILPDLATPGLRCLKCGNTWPVAWRLDGSRPVLRGPTGRDPWLCPTGCNVREVTVYSHYSDSVRWGMQRPPWRRSRRWTPRRSLLLAASLGGWHRRGPTVGPSTECVPARHRPRGGRQSGGRA